MGRAGLDSAGRQATRARSSFHRFYETEWAGAVRTAALLAQDRSVAEEIVQDAMAQIMRRWDDLENPAAYLRRSVANGAMGHHRHRTVQHRKLPLLAEAGDPPELVFLADAIAELPARQRAVIVLRYWNRLTEREVADLLGCRLGTVKSAHARALAALGEALS